MEEPKNFTPDEGVLSRFMTYRLARLHARLNVQASRILQDVAGLSLTQWRVLSLVGSHRGATATQLTRVSAMDKGLFSRKKPES